MPNSDTLGAMMQRGEYYSDTMSIIQSQYQEATGYEEKERLREIMEDLRESDLDQSERAKSLSENSDSIANEMNAWKQKHIMEHPTIVSYYLLDMQLRYYEDQVDVSKAKSSYEILAKKFPGHPYNVNIRDMIDALSNIKVGGKYVDFTAPDLQGNGIQLSEAIDGKIALIDLWASWCGPCIRHSRSMIPIYEEFKDSGFTIVGVASEFDNTDQMVQTIEREGFPWLNLVELDKQNRIWEKYGIPNSGGRSFLVDRDGTILAIHPSDEETKEILQKKLN
jgi:peroxiredoxin